MTKFTFVLFSVVFTCSTIQASSFTFGNKKRKISRLCVCECKYLKKRDGKMLRLSLFDLEGIALLLFTINSNVPSASFLWSQTKTDELSTVRNNESVESRETLCSVTRWMEPKKVERNNQKVKTMEYGIGSSSWCPSTRPLTSKVLYLQRVHAYMWLLATYVSLLERLLVKICLLLFIYI